MIVYSSRLTEGRAAQGREFSSMLNREAQWRRGRLRDVVSARELCIEFENILPRALRRRQLALTDVVSVHLGPQFAD